MWKRQRKKETKAKSAEQSAVTLFRANSLWRKYRRRKNTHPHNKKKKRKKKKPELLQPSHTLIIPTATHTGVHLSTGRGGGA